MANTDPSGVVANAKPEREAAAKLLEAVEALLTFIPPDVNPVVLDRRLHLDRLAELACDYRRAARLPLLGPCEEGGSA